LIFIYFTILLFLIVDQTAIVTFRNSYIFSKFIVLSSLICFSVIILISPEGNDIVRYLARFSYSKEASLREVFNSYDSEPLFNFYQWILSKIFRSGKVFLLTNIVLSWSLIYFALIKKLNFKSIALVFFSYISFFYFYNFYRNILRQGIAFPFLILMIFYLADDKYKSAIMCLVVSTLFHVTASLGLVLLLIKKFNFRLKSLLIAYSLSIILMFTRLHQTLVYRLANLIGGEFSRFIYGYSSSGVIDRYGSINRIDFLLFSIVWAVWAVFFVSRYLSRDSFYLWLVKAYIGFNMLFVLFSFIGYSDRVAGYSWSLIPILIGYPVTVIKSKYIILWRLLAIAIVVGMFFFFGVYRLYL